MEYPKQVKNRLIRKAKTETDKKTEHIRKAKNLTDKKTPDCPALPTYETFLEGQKAQVLKCRLYLYNFHRHIRQLRFKLTSAWKSRAQTGLRFALLLDSPITHPIGFPSAIMFRCLLSNKNKWQKADGTPKPTPPRIIRFYSI